MLVLYLLGSGSTKKTCSVLSCKKVEKYYLLQILQQPDDVDILQKTVNLRTEWKNPTPICTPQNLYYTILNDKIRVLGTTKKQNRRYNCKNANAMGKNSAFKKK